MGEGGVGRMQRMFLGLSNHSSSRPAPPLPPGQPLPFLQASPSPSSRLGEPRKRRGSLYLVTHKNHPQDILNLGLDPRLSSQVRLITMLTTKLRASRNMIHKAELAFNRIMSFIWGSNRISLPGKWIESEMLYFDSVTERQVWMRPDD